MYLVPDQSIRLSNMPAQSFLNLQLDQPVVRTRSFVFSNSDHPSVPARPLHSKASHGTQYVFSRIKLVQRCLTVTVSCRQRMVHKPRSRRLIGMVHHRLAEFVIDFITRESQNDQPFMAYVPFLSPPRPHKRETSLSSMQQRVL
jgi:hypothetical protein